MDYVLALRALETACTDLGAAAMPQTLCGCNTENSARALDGDLLGQLLQLPRSTAQAILATVRAEDLPRQRAAPDQETTEREQAQRSRWLAHARSLPAVVSLLDRLLSAL